MNKTYNNIIDSLKLVGDKHLMIKKVESGDLWDMDLEKNTKYPLMFINPESVTANVTTLTMNFRIFICDLVMADDSNEQEILSDTLQIALDVITLIREQSYEGLYTQDDFNIEPFTERFDNALAGWTFNLPVEVENDYQTCNIPTL
tara:strand:- start:1529 stop:1966 length:438 start_codon:yes stop_codon:yes gene_type:complete